MGGGEISFNILKHFEKISVSEKTRHFYFGREMCIMLTLKVKTALFF